MSAISEHRYGVLEHGQLSLRQLAQIVFLAPPLDIRIAPYCAEPRAGGIEQHSVESSGERKAGFGIGLDDMDVVRAGPPNRFGQQVDPARSNISRHDGCGWTSRIGHDQRLAAGRGTGIEDPFARTRSNETSDELRGFILDEEQAVVVKPSAHRIAMANDQRVWCTGGRLRFDPRRRKRLREL